MAAHMIHTAPNVRFKESDKNVLDSNVFEIIQNFLCLFRRKEEEFGRYMDTYRGNSQIYCGGRVVIAPKQIRNVSVTITLTVFPSYYFLTQIIPQFEESEKMELKNNIPSNLAPFGNAFAQQVPGYLYWICLTLLVTNLLSIFMCALSNPGIVPRDLPYTKRDKNDDGLHEEFMARRHCSRYVTLHGVELKQKYCTSCHIYRPPRSKHCALCDNCVLRFDHHCVILGACVGLHNYRWFLLLIYSANIHITIAMVVSSSLISRIINETSHGFLDTIKIFFENIVLTVFIVFTVVVFLATIVLTLYHTGITSRNLTTNEHVKNYYKENPFDHGPVHNFKHTCCYPEALLMEETEFEEPSYFRMAGSTNSECLSFDEI